MAGRNSTGRDGLWGRRHSDTEGVNNCCQELRKHQGLGRSSRQFAGQFKGYQGPGVPRGWDRLRIISQEVLFHLLSFRNMMMSFPFEE